MRFRVEKSGMLTTVQDLGRRGYQLQGVPVAGAMDACALRLGNLMLGNDEGAAALETTLLGPTLIVEEGSACCVVTGADSPIKKNNVPVEPWRVFRLNKGDTLALSAPKNGVRSYLCFSGGIDVPLVMGSRSTYTRGRFGGLEGRALKPGDCLTLGLPDPLWESSEGLECPSSLRPLRDPRTPLRVLLGPQDDAFTPEGIETFLTSEYVISSSADRMGYRMEGPVIAHKAGPDIVSDAVVLGTVQVPGHGQPIVMLADRQTTGGYTKLATVCTADIGVLAQRLPGQTVRFARISAVDAVKYLAEESRLCEEMRRLRAAWRVQGASSGGARAAQAQNSGALRVIVDGAAHNVTWERLE
ncbi:MAG: biotin-dependent carboxyltransferase family protein [Fretibacterium sp.]|nr:biotin-dependent carboxyltransferase family protein [Fretibacterium sp.]